jgi:hypothetical protein
MTDLSDFVEALLEEDGDEDDDATDGGDGPCRCLVELPRVAAPSSPAHGCCRPTLASLVAVDAQSPAAGRCLYF